MTFLFWTFLFLITYCYFIYPAILYALAAVMSRPVHKGDDEPFVSVVLSVWNEEDVIRPKLENILSSDYPADKMELIIGSDGSTDQTDPIVQSVADDRIQLIQDSRRRGKMAVLNDLVSKAKGEVLVFTDARQKFAPDAIKVLIQNLSDPKVGCVSGELMFAPREGATAQGISLYWNYEKFIRRAESRLHSMLGATGAIYAIRRELYTPIPEHIVLDDMFVPLKIIQKGFRAVLDPDAKAYDVVADSPREEHRRKARTLYGNYQIFWLFRGMFNPFTSPVAVQLFSHKFLRVVIPFLMIAVFILNGVLRGQFPYDLLFIMQIVFYGMAVTGGLARYQKYGILKVLAKICYIPYVFCLLNFSALAGFLRFTAAGQDSAWEKARDVKKTSS